MSDVAVAKAPENAPAAEIVVDPQRTSINVDGFAYRSIFVRLPIDAAPECLKDPTIWAKVQGNRNTSLRRHDHLYIVAFDETWVAEAIVSDADGMKAVLVISKVQNFPSRYDRLFEDSLYKVVWNGMGFVVVRKSDLRVMGNGVHHTAALAERALANLYPRPAA